MILDLFRLNGKVAVITGANTGLGQGFCVAFAEAGATVIGIARRSCAETAAKVEAVGGTFFEVLTDLSAPDASKTVANACKKLTGRVDILVNNAGFGAFGEFYKTDLNNELNLIDLNIKAVHILTKLYLRDFREKNRGYILNTASLAGFCVGPLMSTYYASKAYVLRLTQSIKQELEQENSNVHICALCPGPVDTGFNKRAGVNFSMKPLTSDYVAKYAIRKMFQKKTVIVPGIVCKFSAVASKLLPSGIIGKVCYEIQKNKSK